jgi:hypothetical protein
MAAERKERGRREVRNVKDRRKDEDAIRQFCPGTLLRNNQSIPRLQRKKEREKNRRA